MKNLCLRICRKIVWECKRVVYFILPNLRLILSKKMTSCVSTLSIYQPVNCYTRGGIYKIGKNVQFGYDIGGRNKYGYCELQSRNSEAIIEIGDYTAINNNLMVLANKKVTIGSHCRIGINCQIMDFDGHMVDPQRRSEIGNVSEVYIGDNVWIGNNVMILAGTTIGENCVVAAGAVVKGNFESNQLIGGIPAKVIKKI